MVGFCFDDLLVKGIDGGQVFFGVPLGPPSNPIFDSVPAPAASFAVPPEHLEKPVYHELLRF
jgi:hypothetical protein